MELTEAQSSPKPFLKIKNATVAFLGKIVFKDLDITFHHGEHLAVIGNESSHLSMFLKMFIKNYKIVKGSIEYCFYNDFKSHLKHEDSDLNIKNLIAFVGQKHEFKNLSNTQGFYYQQRYNAHDSEDAPTVKAYLSKIVNPQNQRWELEGIIQLLDLGPLVDEHIIKLSNGETKRLLIAAALLKNPTLLLLDHPFIGLDISMREKLNIIISKIAGAGITIIMATTTNAVPDAISHIAVLEDKKIASYNTKSVFEKHKSFLFSKINKIKEPDFAILKCHEPVSHFEVVASLQNISITYGDKKILKNISWHISSGERWALLGPNGAGKTTLLSLLNGDNPQSYANDIVLFDRKRGSGESIWEIKEKIGFVSPELYQYFPSHFSCIKVVESGFYDSVGFYRKSNPNNAGTSLQMMCLLGIDEDSEKLFHAVPANIQRLCLLARAIVKNPPLLLLDEPCQGLNEQEKEFIKKLINKICEWQNTALVYVTHYPEEIPSCVNQLLTLNDGEILFKGKIDHKQKETT
ncbi:MAG: ATP-binding cassette domain-containing protein [Bacteroidota bacterium]|nr:ATP-binding cassette domain-containing protein [Bacteroidota bacterium]